MAHLSLIIRQAQQQYYMSSSSDLKDEDFDILFQELIHLENEHPSLIRPDSPTQLVGFPVDASIESPEISSSGRKRRPHTHKYPMQSLKTIFEQDALSLFLQDVYSSSLGSLNNGLKDIVIESKYDGIALSLEYESGTLRAVATRGNGNVGELITQRVIDLSENSPNQINLENFQNCIRSILRDRCELPKQSAFHTSPETREKIEDTFSTHPIWLGSFIARCEGVASTSSFHKANEARKAAGKMLFSNPRNAVVGTVLSLQSPILEFSPSLYLFCYQLILPSLSGVEGNDGGEVIVTDADTFFQSLSHTERMRIAHSVGLSHDVNATALTPTVSDIRNGHLDQVKQYIAQAQHQSTNGTSSLETDLVGLSDFYQALARAYVAKQGLDFDTDGLVLKVNAQSARQKLGGTSRAPNWSIALKFPSEKAQSTLDAVTLQVGRSGRVTPVAEISPVQLCGAKISRATLHHLDFLREGKLDGLTVTDTIFVERAGDVIPTITSRMSSTFQSTGGSSSSSPSVSVLASLPRNDDGVLLCPCADRVPLQRCSGESSMPAFLSPTESMIHDLEKGYLSKTGLSPTQKDLQRLIMGDTMIYCRSPLCEAQWPRKLAHYASRQALDIQGLSLKIIEKLAGMDLISKELSSLANLAFDEGNAAYFRKIGPQTDGFGTKSVENILSSIREAHLNASLAQVLNGLGVRGLGSTHSKTLSNHFDDNICRILAASVDEIASLPGFGPLKAFEVRNALQANFPTLQSLARWKLPCLVHLLPSELSAEDQVVETERKNDALKALIGPLTGLSVAFSGSAGVTKQDIVSAALASRSPHLVALCEKLLYQLDGVEKVPRALLGKIAEVCGATSTSSVTKATSMLFCTADGDGKVSSKMKKASSDGIAVHDYHTFLLFISQTHDVDADVDSKM